jgi:hypothetical protein
MEEAATPLNFAGISALLQQRAVTINQTLQQNYRYVQVQNRLDEFNRLHGEHVEALNGGDIVKAHAILLQIHALSRALERDEFWTRHWIEQPYVRLRISPYAFRDGPIVKMYMDTPFAHLRDDEARRMRIPREKIEAIYMAVG